MQNLAKDFRDRSDFFSNRSSAIFPVFFSSIKNDFLLIFLNYWTIKNNISQDSLSLTLRIYDSSGKLHVREVVDINATHNQISIRNYISETKFKGMVEAEIISTSNLKFTFPAILGAYQTGELFSVVHSAGRIKNSDEPQLPAVSEESNWSCKFQKGITPFFHIFNGPRILEEDTEISVRNSNGEILDTKKLKTKGFSPFQSEIYFANKIFDNKYMSGENFITVKCNHNSIFPRMVVGNYFENINHMEVTHSFPVIKNIDHCPIPKDKDSSTTFINCYTAEGITLDCRIFPTNCEGEFTSKVYSQRFSDKKLKLKNNHDELENREIKRLKNLSLRNDEKFIAFHLFGKAVPSRINTSFRYKVKAVNSDFSTDIATGAKSTVYPPKYRHWGHGLIGKGYKCVILIRNNMHLITQTEDTNAKLKIFFSNFKKETKFLIHSESAYCININSILGIDKVDEELQFFSWMLETDKANCETFWLSFRETDGIILGEHGF